MPYKDLRELICSDNTSRDYFLSLPAELQLSLHEQSKTIHTPEELKNMTASLKNGSNRTAIQSGEL